MKRSNHLIVFLLATLVACSPQPQTTVPVENHSPTADVKVEDSTVSTPEVAPLTHLNVCYSSISPTQAAAWYAYENGLFEKNGLEVELTLISSGSKSVTALIAGDVDICQVAISGIVNAVAAGQDVVYIAGLVNTYPGSLYVTPELASGGDALKGTTFAVSQPGSANTVATSLVLRQLGLDPLTDVTFLSIGSEPERLAALETGQADGALLFPPATLKAQESGFQKLFDLGKTKLPYQFVGVGTTHAFIEENRVAVTAFVKAMVEAVALMQNDPEGTKAVLAKYLELDPVTEAANLEETYQAIILNAFETKPYPSIAGIQTVIDSLYPENPDVANITPEQTIDLSILDELEKSGFFAGLP